MKKCIKLYENVAVLMVFRKSHLRVNLPENASSLPGSDNREIETNQGCPNWGMVGPSSQPKTTCKDFLHQIFIPCLPKVNSSAPLSH